MNSLKNILRDKLCIVCMLAASVGAFAFWISSGANAARTTGAMPALYGIRAIVMNPAAFDGKNDGRACDVSTKAVHERFAEIFKEAGLPIITDLNKWQRNPSVATLYFDILLSTSQDANMECSTLIVANAKNRANLAVPPIPQTRDIQLLYWDSMRRIFTIQPIHGSKVFETIDKMANDFVAQYKEANQE